LWRRSWHTIATTGEPRSVDHRPYRRLNALLLAWARPPARICPARTVWVMSGLLPADERSRPRRSKKSCRRI
jgi:hypothetical protein